MHIAYISQIELFFLLNKFFCRLVYYFGKLSDQQLLRFVDFFYITADSDKLNIDLFTFVKVL